MPATALTFNDVNEAYVSDVIQLPPITESLLKPDTTAQTKGHIAGYIDILGYTDAAQINGVTYSIGSPVVRGNAWVQKKPSGKQDSFTQSISISNDSKNTYAVITATLKWHTIACDKFGCYVNGRFTDTQSFQDTEPLPERPPILKSPELIVYEFQEPNRTVLEVREESIITSFNVSNKNGYLTRHVQIGQVEYTDKGIPFANFTSQLPIWKHAGTGIYQQGTDIVLEDSNFTFSARTPFGIVTVLPNITTIKVEPTSVSPFFFLILTFFGLGAVVIKFAVNRI